MILIHVLSVFYNNSALSSILGYESAYENEKKIPKDSSPETRCFDASRRLFVPFPKNGWTSNIGIFHNTLYYNQLSIPNNVYTTFSSVNF